jgi:hypothetical protein
MFEAYSHSNHEGLIAASCIEKEVRLGQNAKYSLRADVFRFASKFRHCSMRSALRIKARSDTRTRPR